MKMRDEDFTRRNRTDDQPGELKNDPLVTKPRSGAGTLGLMAAIVVAIALGLFFWNTADNANVASNTSPGVTTGSSTASPPAQPNGSKTDSR